MANSARVKLQEQGTDHVLIIDKSLMDQMGIDADTPLQLTVTDGNLVVSPVSSGVGKAKVADALNVIRREPGYSEMLNNLAQ